MRLKYGIAVAGTHGKTTTTSMVGAVLAEGRYDPTIIVGGARDQPRQQRAARPGRVPGGRGRRVGRLVPEARPTIAVVTTIDAEHLDHYGTLEALQEAFATFVAKVPFYGAAVLCLDQPNIQRLIPRLEKRVITYGLEAGADLVARRLRLGGDDQPLRGLATRRAAGRVRAGHSRPAQRAQRAGRHRRRARPRDPVCDDRQGAGRVRRRAAPLPGPGHGRSHHRRRRLRPTIPSRSARLWPPPRPGSTAGS